jgi:hypothetical protein
MDRITVSFPQVTMAWLRRESKRLGVTIGELLRRIVDEARSTK